ncbi:MAG: hypothetical protein IPN40_14950 [Uliginosibacterium sp.]|nr:hypothetical protein [Uliginosibacterium sp.]
MFRIEVVNILMLEAKHAVNLSDMRLESEKWYRTNWNSIVGLNVASVFTFGRDTMPQDCQENPSSENQGV